MKLKIDDGTEITVTRSGTYLVSEEYLNPEAYEQVKQITVTEDDGTETVYDYPEILENRWDGEQYYIGFRVMSVEEVQAAADEAAAGLTDYFPDWCGAGVPYKVGNRVQYNGVLYKVLQAHTSQSDWTPDVAVSLFARTDGVNVDDDGDGENDNAGTDSWPEWVQPTGATDAYPKDAQVSHNGKHWISDVDNNVWEPGVSQWTEATE